jgi:hypothetical protein
MTQCKVLVFISPTSSSKIVPGTKLFPGQSALEMAQLPSLEPAVRQLVTS